MALTDAARRPKCGAENGDLVFTQQDGLNLIVEQPGVGRILLEKGFQEPGALLVDLPIAFVVSLHVQDALVLAELALRKALIPGAVATAFGVLAEVPQGMRGENIARHQQDVSTWKRDFGIKLQVEIRDQANLHALPHIAVGLVVLVLVVNQQTAIDRLLDGAGDLGGLVERVRWIAGANNLQHHRRGEH
jgi:hypothetical protein